MASLLVDPKRLRLPPSRNSGADLAKLARQMARFGNSTAGMPPLFVFRAADGELVIYDGVTRATRVARHLPGQLVTVEIIGTFKTPASHLPTIEDQLP